MFLDRQARFALPVGGKTPVSTDQALRNRGWRLPGLVAHDQARLQVITDIRLVRYCIGVSFIDVFVAQMRPVMHT